MDGLSIRDLDKFYENNGGPEAPCPAFAENHKNGATWYVECVLPLGHTGNEHVKVNGETFRGIIA